MSNVYLTIKPVFTLFAEIVNTTWSRIYESALVIYASYPLLINLLEEYGGVSATLVRNSSQFGIDNENVMHQIPAGVPVFDGMRPLDNWVLASEGPCDTAPWVLNNGSGLATVSGNTVYFAPDGTTDQLRQFNFPVKAGVRYVLGVDTDSISDNGCIFFNVNKTGGGDFNIRKSFYPGRGTAYAMFTPATDGTAYVLITQLTEIGTNGVEFSINKVNLATDTDTNILGKIVMIGDSLTFGGTATRLGEMYDSATTQVVNAGVAGDTLQQMAARFDADVLAQSPDRGILWGGVNGAATATVSPVGAETNAFKEMCDKFEANNIPYGVSTISPWKGSSAWTEQRQIWSDEINTVIIAEATRRGVYCVRMDEIWLGNTPQTLEHSIALDSDFLHPNPNGYSIAATAFSKIFGRDYPEYVKTTNVAGIMAWSDLAHDGVPLTTSRNGILLEPLSTNLGTHAGVPAADSYATALVATETMPKGKVFEIVTRVTLDFDTIGTLLSGTANTAGATYLITGVAVLGTGDSAKEIIDAIGTQAFYDTAWNNPFTGQAVSGLGTDAKLSILADQIEIDILKYARITNSYKVYDITTGPIGAVDIDFAGAMAAVPTSMSIVARVISGSAVMSDNTGANSVALTGTGYARTKKENFTPLVGSNARLTIAASSQVRYIVQQTESLPFSTGIIPCTAGATGTREATITSVPTPIYTSGIWHETVTWTPRSVIVGRVETLLDQMVDVNNGLRLISDGSAIYFEKMAAGVSERASLTMLLVKDITYVLDPRMLADNTLSLLVDGVPEDTNTSTTSSVTLGTTTYIGSDGVNSCFANIQNVLIDNKGA